MTNIFNNFQKTFTDLIDNIFNFLIFLRWRSLGLLIMFLILFTNPNFDKLLLTIGLSIFIYHSYRIYKLDKGETHQTLLSKIDDLSKKSTNNQQTIIKLLQNINQKNQSKFKNNKT